MQALKWQHLADVVLALSDYLLLQAFLWLLQALAYQWLGRWYEDIDQDFKQAQHCYERAVVLDDDDIIAGKLCLRLRT